jgi:hypothetical protein
MAAVLVAASSCVGNIGSGSGVEANPESEQGPLGCDPDAVLATQPTRRLTLYEYGNTLRALVGDEAYQALSGSLALVPLDRTADALDSLAQDVTVMHVRAYFGVAEAVGTWFEEHAEARAALAPCFEDTSWGRPCVEELISGFGARLYRRPPSDETVVSLLALYDEAADGGRDAALRVVLTAMFQAPDVLFRLEIDGERDGDAVSLTSREIANRLAYYLWGEPPDDALIAAAEDGSLDTPAGLSAHVDRMAADERAKRHVAHFSTQWLALDRVDDVENVPAHVTDGTPVDGLNAAAIAEIEQLVDYVVWEQRGSYAQLMTTTTSFVENENLAQIYQVEPGTADAPMVELPESRRGLLTRLAFVANADGVGDPIHRGERVRVQLLCDELSPPDADSLPPGSLEDPLPDPTKSTRQRVEEKTAGAVCTGCHQWINPLGFAMEGFDGLARLRSTEKIFDDQGELLAEVPIDARVDPQLVEVGVTTIDGAAELASALAQEPKANACLAERWLEFTSARTLPEQDACGLEPMTERLLGEEGSIIGMISRFTELPSFRVKRVDD